MACILYNLYKNTITFMCLCMDGKFLEDIYAGVKSGYWSRGGVETRYGEGEFYLSFFSILNFTLNMYFITI